MDFKKQDQKIVVKSEPIHDDNDESEDSAKQITLNFARGCKQIIHQTEHSDSDDPLAVIKIEPTTIAHSPPDLSDSSSNSPERKRFKTLETNELKGTRKLTSMIKQYLINQEQLISRQPLPAEHQLPLKNYEAFLYWDSILERMTPEKAQEVKFAMTKLLQDLAIKDREKKT